MDQATVPPPHDTVWALGCPNSRPPPAQTRPEVPDAPSGRALDAVNESGFATVGDRFTSTASAEAVGSWIRRLSHHRTTPCGLWDAQSPARHPHRLVLRFRCEVELDARRAAGDDAPGSAVTVTTSAEVVGSSIGRLSHHRMMSGNVCDGLQLVRRPYNGRLTRE